MVKNKIYVIISIIFAFFVGILVLIKNNNSNKIEINGVKYAINVDGKKTNKIPSKGMYNVDAKCTNAKGVWDYDKWMLRVRDIMGDVLCDIEFNTLTKTYINNKIIGLSGTTQGTGQVVNEKGYRYEGKNPNNYVWFNNELWRIIGVFDSETHNVSNTNLVKIIRANPIGGLAWDKSDTNDWSNSSLYNLLNGAYYNKQNGTDSGYCYSDSTTVLGNCDYSNIGIDAGYRNMIKEVTWKVGGHTIASATADTFYIAERGSATGNSNAYSSTKSGYIGLMYPSDYGYSVLSSSCARTTNLNSYSSSSYAGQSWLAGQGDELTLTPRSSTSNNVFVVRNYGSLNYFNASYGYAARPSLYLDSSVYVLDGTGSESDPYIIGMDEVSE